MDDIVEELRTFAEVVDTSKGSAQLVMLSGDVFSTAAAEIERLKAETSDWQNTARHLLARIASLTAEIENLRSVSQRQAMELLVAHSEALGLYDTTTPTHKETRRG